LVWAGEIQIRDVAGDDQFTSSGRVRRAREATVRTYRGLCAAIDFELVALDLRIAVTRSAKSSAKTATEDLLDAIFSQFVSESNGHEGLI